MSYYKRLPYTEWEGRGGEEGESFIASAARRSKDSLNY